MRCIHHWLKVFGVEAAYSMVSCMSASTVASATTIVQEVASFPGAEI